jgi:hypothetical protein
MPVRLDEARHDAAVAEFDGLGAGSDPPGDVGAVTDRDDPPVGHRERFGGGTVIVHGQHRPEEDQLSRHERIQAKSRKGFFRKLSWRVSISGVAVRRE